MGSRTATVSWSPPHDRNGQLMEYRVRIVPGVSQWKTVSKSTLSYHANGLLPNTFYRAYVVAINNRSRELISEFATTTFTTNTEGTLDWCADAMYCTLSCCCFLSFFSSTKLFLF